VRPTSHLDSSHYTTIFKVKFITHISLYDYTRRPQNDLAREIIADRDTQTPSRDRKTGVRNGPIRSDLALAWSSLLSFGLRFGARRYFT
jgi:hypothetical protein